MPNRHDRADNNPLRWLIREKLLDGRLPRDNAATVFGAPADGSEICVVCEIRIARGQLVIGGGPRTGEHHQSMPFHVACFEVWNDERRAPKTWLNSDSRPETARMA